MIQGPFSEYLPYVAKFLAARYGRLTEADREDILQDIAVAITKRLKTDATFVPDGGWPTYLTRAAINLANEILQRLERGWFQSLADDALEPAAARSIGCGDIADEARRRHRQSLLLSDILREYVAHCEEKRMQTQKEIYERRLRGMEVTQIAAAMELNDDNVYQHLKRARDWIMERIRQADVDRSVFLTFLRPYRDVPARELLPDSVPKNFNEVLQLVVNEAGALCPGESRMKLYQMSPESVEFRDVDYHVEQARCSLCIAGVWTPE